MKGIKKSVEEREVFEKDNCDGVELELIRKEESIQDFQRDFTSVQSPENWN